jgi:hypothetical protein
MKPLLALPLACLLAGRLAAEPVDYLRDVKPILARHCYECHGPQKQRSGLRLDTAAAALKGGVSGAVILPGKGNESKLIKAVTGAEDVKRMPPKEPRLSTKQIALLKAWIDQGAKAPAHELTRATVKHWAFVPPVRPSLPAVKDQAWVRNPIDRFILARLEKEGIRPSPEADRITLIRRLSFDLLGLPPTIQEVDDFLADRHSDAYERLVDRLLDSPHYGERWARHWLDLARYADSNGYSIDAPRSIWKYRDWVIDAFNKDMPFDRFVTEQLAGDLLPNATVQQQVATGFHRNTPFNEEGGIDLEQFRVESIVDRVNTTGAVFLGLTLGCAQCHDHKFDPIAQREYYQFFAFFNSCDEPVLEVPTPDQTRQRHRIRQQVAVVEKRLKVIDSTSLAKQLAWEKSMATEAPKSVPHHIRTILYIPRHQRTPQQQQILDVAFRNADKVRHVLGGLGSVIALVPAIHANVFQVRAALEHQVEKLEHSQPAIPTTLVLHERATPRKSYVHLGGDFLRKGAEVIPDVPAVLNPLPRKDRANRLDLARWLVDPRNPLTARVTVNRFWQHYFGLGLVETENDFGTQGTPPSHSELLDWLATEFIRQQWSMKGIHRCIVTSATYRQSSRVRPELAAVDPRNRLLARQGRLRLDAEIVRDTALAVSGRLSQEIGGPSVYPPQPKEVYRFTQVVREWKESTGEGRYRRGLYTTFWRSMAYPSLTVFDAPNAISTCTRRIRSNTPLQALTLLNDQGFFELAQGLAVRVLREAKPTAEDWIRHAFQLCLARLPHKEEQIRLTQLFEQELAELEQSPAEAQSLAPVVPGTDARQRAALTTVARVLLNLDEFITRE